MSITVREKEHWKERIARKIERAVIDLVAAEDPTYLDRLAMEARRLAIAEVGGEQLVDRIRELEKSRDDIKLQLEDAQRALVTLVRGKAAATYGYVYNAQSDWESAVKERAGEHQQQLLGRDALGQKILRLRREQEELLDTVWLATSPSQIRELWKGVASLLADPLTPLQVRTLAGPTDDAA